MFRILSSSKDSYITNKIIKNSFRATDANVGSAGTLDLFKLYNESKITGETNPIEYSRILIKFPVLEIKQMDDQKLIDINDTSFKAYIKLHDVYGGQTTPKNFHAILFPLAKPFDEGNGFDIVNFSDLGSTNFITSSIINGQAIEWDLPGAMKSGSLNDNNIDVIVSGTLFNEEGPVSLSPIQYFETGEEDLFIDVTTIVSGTCAGLIPDYGFLIALSGSYEKNDKTYFVKRFASRDSTRSSQRPKLLLKFNDSINDSHNDMIFNITSSLFLQNYHHDNLSNILSGSSAIEVEGENCMILKIESGSFKKTFDVSQAMIGRHRKEGIYSASFSISSYDELLYNDIVASGSITFNEVWTNSQETVTYLSSSLVVKKENRRIANTKNQNNVLVSVLNLSKEYTQGEKINIRVFAEDRDKDIVYVKTPFEKKSQIFNNMYYRVVDALDGSIIIDFDKSFKSTKLSTDNDGMFFNFYTDSLPKGRLYQFEFLITRNNSDTVIRDAASKFKII